MIDEDEGEILGEIRRFREEHARSQNYSVQALFEELRAADARLRAEGWKFADFSKKPATATLREDPPATPGTSPAGSS